MKKQGIPVFLKEWSQVRAEKGMDIWGADKLTVFILFVVPGFICLKVYGLLAPRQERDSSQQLVDAVAYSSINYALLLWPILAIEGGSFRDDYPSLYMAFWAFCTLISPALLGVAFFCARQQRWLQRYIPHPTEKPWDHVFGKREPYWIVVTLKDGKQWGGLYGYNSFSSSSPAQEQLYLEESWQITAEGGFERPKETTAGILILSSDIEVVELFHWRD